jgi:hypothetical protein
MNCLVHAVRILRSLRREPRAIGGSGRFGILDVALDGRETEVETVELTCCGGPRLRDVVTDQLEQGYEFFILDLGLSPQDSETVSDIVELFCVVENAKGRLAVIGLHPRTMKVMRTASLTDVISTFDSVATALEHFKPSLIEPFVRTPPRTF